MIKIITLAFTLTIILGSAFAQKIDYDNSSKWFMGFNAGGTWQTTDVANKTNLGYGVTLGRSFNYSYGKQISFDIRGRYLGGNWYGQDYKKTDLTDYTEPTLQNYKESLGFSVNNFQTQVHRLAIELVLHANGLRERTGWDAYIFGGVGYTWFQSYGDLSASDSSGISYYNYDESQLGKPYINTLLDGQYETNLIKTVPDAIDKWTTKFMPSLGFGIGYQIGKRVTLGIEHKTTFTMIDNFDGFTSTAQSKNDLYHYTSMYLNFHFKTRNKDPKPVTTDPNSFNNIDNYNQQNNPCLNPTVRFITPTTSGVQTANMSYTVVAEIKEVVGNGNIVFKLNGVNNLNFTYNDQTDRFESTVILASGFNTFEIVANNTCGSANQTSSISYQNCQLPIIAFVNPVSNGLTVSNPIFNLNAVIQHLGSGQLSVSQNNMTSSNYTFNSATGSFQNSFTLLPGLNTFVISTTNACGTDSKTITVNYQACNIPVIAMVTPYSSGTTVNNATFNFSAQVQNATAGQITVKLNNRVISNFNLTNGLVKSTVTLQAGLNTFQITATNTCGTASETITVNYQNCIPPSISISTPTNTTVSVSNFILSATIQNSNNGQGITFKQNNQTNTNYSFNSLSGTFQTNVILTPGLNTFVITSTNACGTDTETITVNYQNCIPPSISISTPTNTTVSVSNFILSATIQNSNNGQGITFKQNNQTNTNYSFNSLSGTFQTNVILTPGLNTFVITSTNACGTDSETITVNKVRDMNNTVVPEQEITICHIPPGNSGNPQTLIIPLSAWPAHQAHGDNLGACVAVTPPNPPVPEQEITICHIPPGNSGNPQTLTIPISAWPAHQAHGDNLGACVAVTPPNPPVPEQEITICHIPPGNSGNPQTLIIPLSAWPAHQAHGDNLGECVAVTPPNPPAPVAEEKITICHIPPGNSGNPQTLIIPLSAWPAHQAHGDNLGECVVVVPPSPPPAERTTTICHIPPGNSGNPQTLIIPLSAWPAHQAHGDNLGACVEENNEGNDSNGESGGSGNNENSGNGDKNPSKTQNNGKTPVKPIVKPTSTKPEDKNENKSAPEKPKPLGGGQ